MYIVARFPEWNSRGYSRINGRRGDPETVTIMKTGEVRVFRLPTPSEINGQQMPPQDQWTKSDEEDMWTVNVAEDAVAAIMAYH